VLLADRFTYVHEPKTGGTFVKHVLTQVHRGLVDVRPTRRRGPLLRRLRLGGFAFYAERGARRNGDGKYGTLYNWNDHGLRADIPVGYRRRPMLATVRNPFETYVSLYLFGWWKRPEAEARYGELLPEFGRTFPNYPDLAFPEFMQLLDAESSHGIGYLSERFVRFYFRRPERALARASAGDIDADTYRQEVGDLRFIRTSRLNDDLPRVLVDLGYEHDDVAFIRDAQHVVPAGGTKVAFIAQAQSSDWARYYDDDLIADVRRRDALLFSLFPELSEGTP
jgi:hypothetical protein